MNSNALKEQATNEIESTLWKLGNGNDSVFPSFELDSINLDYGIQKDENGDILLETKFVNKRTKEKICIRVKVETEEV